MKRGGLIGAGVLFAALFVGVGLVVGVGSSSSRIPPGDIAIVEDAPPGTGTISKVEFDQEMQRWSRLAGLKRTPKPGLEAYERIKGEVLPALVSAVWIRGTVEEMGLSISEREVAEALSSSGQVTALRKAHFTREAMYERVRRELEVRKIQEVLEDEAEKPSAAEIRAYYEEGPHSEEYSATGKTFAESKAEIAIAIQQLKNQELFEAFDRVYPSIWLPRTHCADGFVFAMCAERPLFAHDSAAACYEANPRKPADACQAPVVQISTAQPGSVTPFEPHGESFQQRPYPEVLEGEGE